MANYCVVENGNITEYHDFIPSSWKNISGLNLSKDNLEFLKSVGWYPVEKVLINYDDRTHKLTGYNYEIQIDKVIETPIIQEYSPEEIKVKNENDGFLFFQQLRDVRDILLKESDWTQTLDIQSIKSSEWINSWKNYRQQLRDIPEKYSNTTNFNLSSIDWPKKPTN